MALVFCIAASGGLSTKAEVADTGLEGYPASGLIGDMTERPVMVEVEGLAALLLHDGLL